ncbi:uncharacterized protein JCM15063_003701 [Sporobolomyces koalae]|uniref:uncharacterized protein n=1 Tax=Sporobolomyces koalae TaxID=500713 RepID=UPI003173B9D1
MFKFWKSPKSSSPNPTASPASTGTTSPRVSSSVNNVTTPAPQPQATTGLGITDERGELGLQGTTDSSLPASVEASAEQRRVPNGSSRRQTLEVPHTQSTGHLQGSTGTDRRSSGSTSAASVEGSVNRKGRLEANHHADANHVDQVQLHPRARSLTPGENLGSARAISPMSFSPSVASTFHNPYGPSATALTERDPNQIYAPTTWSDMAHQELVVNLSARERTRQEILWEVVASEERYVAELRSLVEHYVNPLLHPLLASSPALSSPPLYAKSSSPAFTRQSFSAATCSSTDLPIASRFSRSSPGPLSSASLDHLPEIDTTDENTRRDSDVHYLPRHPAGSTPTLGSSNSASRSSPGVTQRFASFALGRARQASSKSHKQQAGSAPSLPPPLPEALRALLVSIADMLKGHEELSARLKDQWAKAFPLVRGLAAIWSDQPWFLQTYATYIISLEETLAIVDEHLPSTNSLANNASSSLPGRHFRIQSAESKRQSKLDDRLTRYLQHLEEEAAIAGESNLSICLSKPLMRMSKLPLLMQALLFHTDPTTHEWEKTRAMALEVDALVRSIEDEKIQLDQRERTRDVLARIEGINERGLMAPRASRILISEAPAMSATPGSIPSGKSSSKRTSRRVSATPNGTNTLMKSSKLEREWLITFTDVVIRARKTGETDVPGSFSREKEKQGKQGKTRKAGPLRNTYRFVRVEHWETAEKAEEALLQYNEREVESEDDSEAGEQTINYAESRMSFRYDSDEPQPTPARNFSSPKRATLNNGRRSASSPAPASAKFAGRLRVGSEETHAFRSPTPRNRHRFDSPTFSSALKSHSTAPVSASRQQQDCRTAPAASRTNVEKKPLPELAVQPPPPNGANVHPLTHSRDESTYNLYKIWSSTQE